jgi:hypothetical protein
MVRKTSKRPAASVQRLEFQPRELLLAGIGAVSLGRKQIIESYAQAARDIDALPAKAESVVKEAENAARKLRKQVEGEVSKFRKQAVALVHEARTQAEKRFAPVFVRLGVKPAPAKRRATKKPATRKTTQRRRAA